MDFSSITIQGNIVSSGIIDRIRNDDIKFQSAADFGLDRKTSVRDEIGVAWAAAKAHYTAFTLRASRLPESESGASETRNSWMIPLLRILGYDVEKALAFTHPDTGKKYAISHKAANLSDFPIHIMGLNDDLDRRRDNSGPRLGPHALTQEYLNNTEHTYALVTNGRYLRLLRDATRLVRLSYLEFNLEKMMEEELYAEFAILFRLLHATRMPKSPEEIEESAIEYYHQESLASGSRIRENLSKAVEASIRELANGFLNHSRNERGNLKAGDLYAELLQLIYRLLFVIVIEERNLVYPESKDEQLQRQRKLYYDFYSIERLRRLALKLHFVDGRKHDLWQGVKATFRLFENGWYGEKLGIKPLGSGIFSPESLGLLPTLYLGNEALLKVVRLLTVFENEQKQQVRVNYSDLDVEEFGSVYEGLLEYDAEFKQIGGVWQFWFVKGGKRSESGAHYTPEELVKPLIRHSLDYVIEEKLKESEKKSEKERALLSIRVCDVACGSGHILLSAARRIAHELANVRTGGDQPSPTALRHALRDVIRTCIYGVDKNPLAVNLCKVALWLEAHSPGEPLNFLDHHIKCGDAIVGLARQEELFKGIADEAFKAHPGDDKPVASALAKRNKAERKQREAETSSLGLQLMVGANEEVMKKMDSLIACLQAFDRLPEQKPEEIAAKAAAYRELQHSETLHDLKLLADLQVMQFFVPKTVGNKAGHVTDKAYFGYLQGGQTIPNDLEVSIVDQAATHRFFHWFLEFPGVFSGKDGCEESGTSGFDVILGNPPYLVGKKISGNYGDEYLNWIKKRYFPANGSVDYVTYFFRRGFELLSDKGLISLITAKVIAQGDSRVAGLEYAINRGAQIIFAIKAIPWPGDASVEISLFSAERQKKLNRLFIGNRRVDFISSYLDDDNGLSEPFVLKTNSGKSFQGSVVLGKGFILSFNQQSFFINKKRENSEVLFDYLIGDDFNNNIGQAASRIVINFFDWTEERCRREYPDVFDIVERFVKPERLKSKDKGYQEKWWQYARRGVDLYEAVKLKKNILVISQNSKPFAFAFVQNSYVFGHKMVVFDHDEYWVFAILQSSLHYIWAVKRGNTLGGVAITYTPTTVYQTFPFPELLSELQQSQLEQFGEAYHENRKQLMLAMQLGLTKTYNLFHARQLRSMQSEEAQLDDKAFQKLIGKDAAALRKHLARTTGTIAFNEAVAGIQKLRSLHTQMDNAVLQAYGWTDLDLRHDFYEVDYLPENDRTRYTIHPEARREVLKRLLELNHKIHAEEVASGLWEKKGTSGKTVKQQAGQIGLNLL